jgi:hypothetical protein
VEIIEGRSGGQAGFAAVGLVFGLALFVCCLFFVQFFLNRKLISEHFPHGYFTLFAVPCGGSKPIFSGHRLKGPSVFQEGGHQEDFADVFGEVVFKPIFITKRTPQFEAGLSGSYGTPIWRGRKVAIPSTTKKQQQRPQG